MIIRPELASDGPSIERVIRDAFAKAPHSSGTEPSIVNALRQAGALTVSLVAVEGSAIVGHAAASPVKLQGAPRPWFGLGPMSVRPERQGQGVGGQLIRATLDRLRSSGAGGCVVLGEPSYYDRFGFRHDPGLRYGDVPPPYFQYLSFTGERPSGSVEYHGSFDGESGT